MKLLDEINVYKMLSWNDCWWLDSLIWP